MCVWWGSWIFHRNAHPVTLHKIKFHIVMSQFQLYICMWACRNIFKPKWQLKFFFCSTHSIHIKCSRRRAGNNKCMHLNHDDEYITRGACCLSANVTYFMLHFSFSDGFSFNANKKNIYCQYFVIIKIFSLSMGTCNFFFNKQAIFLITELAQASSAYLLDISIIKIGTINTAESFYRWCETSRI